MAPDIGSNHSQTDSLAAKLAEFQVSIVGKVCLAGDEAYSLATQPFAKNPLKPAAKFLPVAVIQPRNVRDVAAAVKFARSNSLGLAVKGGGHGIRNDWLAPNVLLLDMSLMRGVYVDALEKFAVVEGGCILEDVDSATSVHKLAVPLGTVSITGMGLALNGGHGNMSGRFGLTCDSVLSYVLVTAEGEVVNVSADSQPDLLWAMKGAGSAFGVVTHIKFRLHDVSSFYGGSFVWVDDPKNETYNGIARFMKEAAVNKQDLGMHIARVVHPQMGPVIVCLVGDYSDAPEAAKAAYLAPLRQLNPVQDMVGKLDHYQTQVAFTPMFRSLPPHAHGYGYWTHVMLTADQMTDDVVRSFSQWKEKVPPGGGMTAFTTEIVGAAAKSSKGPVGAPGGDLIISMNLHWGDPELSQQMLEYAQAFKAEMSKHGSGAHYSNYDSNSQSATGYKLAARMGGEANLQRIRQQKAKWDPDNVFKYHPFDGLVA